MELGQLDKRVLGEREEAGFREELRAYPANHSAADPRSL